MKYKLPTLANIFSRLIAVAVNIYATSVAFRHLGTEYFGIWSVITSFVLVFAAFGDGGIAQGLITTVAKQKEIKGDKGVAETLSAGLLISTILSLILVLIGFLAVIFGDLRKIFGVLTDQEILMARQTFYVVICGLGLGILANIFTNTRHGIGQLVALSNWNSLGSFLIIPSLSIAVYFDASMQWVAGVILYPPILVKFFINGLYLFSHPSIRAQISLINSKTIRLVLTNGGAFFVIAVTQGISQHSDQAIISYFHGPEAASPYILVNRIFATPAFLVTAVINAVWPIFAIYVAKKQFHILRIKFFKLFILSIVFSLISSLTLLFNIDIILYLWLGEIIDYSKFMVLGFACFSLILIPVSLLILLIINLEYRYAQIVFSIVMAITNLLLTIFLVPEWGAVGAITATSISYFVCLFLPCGWLCVHSLWIKN